MRGRIGASMLFLLLATSAILGQVPSAPDDAADVPTRDLRAGGNADLRYFLLGPAKDVAAPAQGYGLLLVLPGGDGSEEFLTFVQTIFRNSLPQEYLLAELVAPKWKTGQVTWPGRKSPTPGMKVPIEAFVEAVIRDVAAKHKIDPKRIFTLSWSSGGPAAYAIALQKQTPVTGSLIAMSVFNPKWLPPAAQVKDRPFYIYHSPGDRVCPFAMAEAAHDALTDAGALVRFVTYQGPHGWSFLAAYDDIRKGIQWLENPVVVEEPPATIPLADNLENGTDGPEGWTRGAAVPGVAYRWDRTTAFDGRASLSFRKTADGYIPIAEWKRTLAYDGRSPAIRVRAMVKAKKAYKATITATFQKASGEQPYEWAAFIGAAEENDPPVSHDWKEYVGTVRVPKDTRRIVLSLQMWGPGEVWFDAVHVEYAQP